MQAAAAKAQKALELENENEALQAEREKQRLRYDKVSVVAKVSKTGTQTIFLRYLFADNKGF